MKKSITLLSFLVISSSPAATNETDLETVRERYHAWVLDTPQTDYTISHVARRYKNLQQRATKALKKYDGQFDFTTKAPLYDTRATGDDLKELFFLITDLLPSLSLAYQLKGPASQPNPYYRDETLRQNILAAFDRLHQRGFRESMLMPWKTGEVADQPSPASQAIIVDFHLRTSGYALATFLMREELREARKLQRTLQTCREIMSHGEKFGSLYNPKQNADGIRLAVNFALPYALAAGDLKHLDLLKRQVDRSMAKESDASDTIKPDGLGFHHRAVYLAGYAPYGVAQATFAAWLFDGTGAACDPVTIENLTHSHEVLRIVSQKYDMHKALAGRLKPAGVIPRVMMGYSYLADIEHPQVSTAEGMLTRLADDDFMKSPMAGQALSPQRNEVPPGPGAIANFYRILSAANTSGAETDPSGHWSFNYGPLSVHRRDNWMVSVKGYSKYLWAFERSLVDARMNARLENVLGFHDSSAHIRIFNQGEPVNQVDSGYTPDGWNWCLIPGATTRLIPDEDFLTMDKESTHRKPLQRPFALSAFAGGLSLDGKHGLFAMQYHEVGPDQRKDPLRAMKALFFFGDEIVAISDKIKSGDGKFPVATTLYQTHLPESSTPTWAQNKSVTGLGKTQRFDDKNSLTLVDAAGNGYYIPRATNVVTQRLEQTNRDQTGAVDASGTFATAWFDHGKNPEEASSEYVILPNAGPEKTAAFAKRAKDTYTVLQRNSRGIIVTHQPLGLTGYVLPRPDIQIEKGLIAQVSAPCFAMTETHDESAIRFSVCNPDLGWERGLQYDYKKGSRDGGISPPMKPVPMPVTLTVRGNWKLATPHPEVIIGETTADTTELHIATSDARTIEFNLQKAGGLARQPTPPHHTDHAKSINQSADDQRPNILYIFTDDQSTRTVSCYPDARPWASTPNIDALAAEGVRFESLYMASFCVPARITQLTGNLPHAARGTFNGDLLTGDALKEEIDRHPFWPQRLRESGYHTSMIGKWHVYSRMPAIGIDWDYAAHWHKEMVNAYYYDSKISINGAEPVPLGGYSVDRHTDLAIDYIRERADGDQPWYLWLCYASPHAPQTPAKRHAGKLDHVTDIPLPPSFPTPRIGKPNYVQKKPMPKISAIEDLVRSYHECILSIDENVGRLTKVLRENGQLDNTIIVFTSDQGLAMGHHGHVKKKNAPYEGTLSAPLIFRYPKRIPANTVCKEPVIGPDLVQTFHEIAGIEAPSTMDGQSLVPLLEKPESTLDRDVLLMTNTRTAFSKSIPNGVIRRNREAREIDEMPMWTMIRSGKFKYATYTSDEAFEEVYDLKSDPDEMINLALSPEHTDLLTDLRQKAASELRQTQSGFDDGHFIDFFPALRGISDLKSQR